MAIPAQRVQLGPFFDDGQLCGGAKLYHYEAGTTTAKAIWSDADQFIELLNPFEADAAGVFNFFADGYYKLVIHKANGEHLYTLDNWKIVDQTIQGLSSGASVPTASSMDIGDSTWAHWTGSTNVTTLTGTALFYWAMADGNFTLVHSSNLVLPSSRNRKVLAGDVLFFINEGSGLFRLGGHMQSEGGWVGRGGASVASASSISLPTDGDLIDITGTATIASIGSAPAGYKFRARFTGAGLNLTNSASLLAPFGRDYRTVPSEILEFQSFGSGVWMYWSLNGPKERVGCTIEYNGPGSPPGFLEEVGGTFSSTTYPGLFAELGTTNLPDKRGRVAIGVDGSANRITSASTNGANADTLWGTGGAETHTLSVSELPAHDHGKTLSAGALSNSDEAGATNTSSVARSDFAVRNTGSGSAHSNTQPWIAKKFFIRF